MANASTSTIPQNPPQLPKRLTPEEGQDLVASWQESGLSVVAFSRQRHVPIHRLSYWRGRLSAIVPMTAEIAAPSRKPARGTFIEMVPEAPSKGLDIIMPLGIRVRIDHGFDPALLRAVVSALAEPDAG